jgi:hypothetical protein
MLLGAEVDTGALAEQLLPIALLLFASYTSRVRGGSSSRSYREE